MRLRILKSGYLRRSSWCPGGLMSIDPPAGQNSPQGPMRTVVVWIGQAKAMVPGTCRVLTRSGYGRPDAAKRFRSLPGLRLKQSASLELRFTKNCFQKRSKSLA